MRRYIVLITLLTLCVGTTVWITSLEWVKEGVYKPFPWSDVLNSTLSHLEMVLTSTTMTSANSC